MTSKFHFAAAVAALAFAGSAQAQSADNSLGTGKTVILSPLNFINDTDLNFGSVVLPTGVAGAIDINPDPSVPAFVTNTGVVPIPASAPARGKLVGAGTAGMDVSVTTVFPTELYLNGDTTAPEQLPVALTLNATAVAANTYSYTIDSGQAFEVYVGGQLTIPAGTVDGQYSNTYTVTATYP